MKTFIAITLVFTFCGLVLCQDPMEGMKKIGDACMEENKSSRKDFEDLAAGKLQVANAPESMKCTVKCFMDKNGFLDDAGELKADVLKAKINSQAKVENLDKALATCKSLKGANPCDTAFQIMTCMWSNSVMKQ